MYTQCMRGKRFFFNQLYIKGTLYEVFYVIFTLKSDMKIMKLHHFYWL